MDKTLDHYSNAGMVDNSAFLSMINLHSIEYEEEPCKSANAAVLKAWKGKITVYGSGDHTMNELPTGGDRTGGDRGGSIQFRGSEPFRAYPHRRRAGCTAASPVAVSPAPSAWPNCSRVLATEQ